jgi:hypothetical protein
MDFTIVIPPRDRYLPAQSRIGYICWIYLDKQVSRNISGFVDRQLWQAMPAPSTTVETFCIRHINGGPSLSSRNPTVYLA